VDFSFTQEQELLRNSLRAFLDDHYGFAARRTAQRSSAGWRPEVWKAFAQDLGILALSFPQSCGGLEGDAVLTLIVMEELGRSLVIEPYLETIVVCGGLLRRAGSSAALQRLGAMGRGELLTALAWAEPDCGHRIDSVQMRARKQGQGWRLHGVKAVVTAAPWCEELLVLARTSGSAGESAGLSLFLVDKNRPGLTSREYPTIDGRRAADVHFEGVSVPAEALLGAEGEAHSAVEQVFDEAIAALSAEATGLLSKLQQDTIGYTKQRRQFGQPIANFQVLQHRMVDMYMQVEMARSAAYLVTLQLQSPPGARALAASAAKVTIGNACRFVGQNAVQLHGGMGMTDDLPVGDYFKRATVIEQDFGDVNFHLSRHAQLKRLTRG